MTTTSQLIERVRSDLRSGTGDQANKLNGNLTAAATSVVLEFDTTGIGQGAVVSVELEDMYVWSVDNATKTLTVERGWNGTTAASHADDLIVYVNSEFRPQRILDVINNEIYAISSPTNGLYAVTTLELTVSSTALTYNLTGVTDLYDILRVQYDLSGTENAWPDVHGWELLRNQETDDFASGFSLRLNTRIEPGRQLRVTYSYPFTALSALTDNVENVSGIPASAVDILELGAQVRLMGVYESKRAQTGAQPDTRRAGEVRPGAALGAASGLLQLRRVRIAEERAKLLAKYPPRRR